MDLLAERRPRNVQPSGGVSEIQFLCGVILTADQGDLEGKLKLKGGDVREPLLSGKVKEPCRTTFFVLWPKFLWHACELFSDRAREMSRERSRGQPGTIEIEPVEPRELNPPGSHVGFASEHSVGIREGFQLGIEIGIELGRFIFLVFSDFQCSRFVAVVFRHGELLSKERPAVDA